MNYEDEEGFEALQNVFEGCDERLPCNVVMRDPWSILAVHLNEDTIFAFLPLATPLEISADKMYMLVIQNLVSKHVATKVTAKQTVEQEVKLPKEVSTTIKTLLFKIRGIDLALSTVKWVADQFPCSPDKILAMKVSVQLAEKWVQQTASQAEDPAGTEQTISKDNAPAILQKLKDKLAQTETEYQLKSLGIFQTIDLSRPLDLIIRIYETEVDLLLEKQSKPPSLIQLPNGSFSSSLLTQNRD